MQYNEELLRTRANKVGEELRVTFNNPDLASISVVRLEPMPDTNPPEVGIYWRATMADGTVLPKEAYFAIEVPDIEGMSDDLFSTIAGSKVFGYLAPELMRD